MERAVRIVIAAKRRCRTDLRIYCRIVVGLADVRTQTNQSKIQEFVDKIPGR